MSCALVLGIDGTVIPSQVSGRTTVLDAPGHGDPAIANRILNLVAHHDGPVLWLTSWGTDAREALEPILGPVDVLGPGQAGETNGKWWKPQALMGWIGQHPDVGSLVWADDELGERSGDVAALVEFAELQGVPVTALDTGSTGGLTDTALKRILYAAQHP